MSRLNLLAVFLFLLTHLSFASGAELENESNQFSYVSGKIQILKNSLSKDQDLISDSELQLKLIELELSDLSQLIAQINQKLAVEQAEIAKLKVLQDSYLSQLTKHRAALAQQILIIYQLGQAQSIKTILNHDNLNNINRHLFYSHYLNEQRLQLMSAIKQILDTLNLNIKTANAHEAKLKILLQTRQTELDKQLIAKKHRQEILAQLQQNTISHQQQLADLEGVLHEVIADLHSTSIQDMKKPFNQLQGKLQWPVKGNITSAVNDDISQHLAGVMIKAPEDTPVHAVASGEVIFANWLRGFGLLVIINHGNGYMSLYARNHTLLAKVGDKIHARDVIAASGNSGGYNKPSVYFEIRQNGTPVDPHLWCS